jgi:hypothetical protein
VQIQAIKIDADGSIAFLGIVKTGISSVSHPFRSKNAEWIGHPWSIVKAKMP